MRRSPCLGVLLAAAMPLVACGDAQDIAAQRFTSSEPGRLTVATALPAPGFWEGADVDRLTGGYEHGLASALADRFDLELDVIDVPFDQIVAGDFAGGDLALAQITVTADREATSRFSTPYLRDDAGAILPAGEDLTDLKTARELRWAVERETVEEQLLDDTIRPEDDPLRLDDVVACVDAVADGTADAALVDLSTALILTSDRDDVVTGARFAIDETIAIAMPADSPNVEVVDAAIRSLDADGTLDELADTWLRPAFGTDPESIPVVWTST